MIMLVYPSKFYFLVFELNSAHNSNELLIQDIKQLFSEAVNGQNAKSLMSFFRIRYNAIFSNSKF